ncbi:serine palmitoyltransferase 2 [Coniophora puteana RWD-64-598 SS2]|uniref:serine C-palmitoyltransferase n=1 Tax=Coniophora puteana (strain RWD-64-598) TaxID=741705 RepID=A0A5M3MN69_CONPW|nr:serine palmitoyltransferase 2 [Coniophora puteana RWD-64-598 SS2]EIW80061.1 serine palmitoyltransferase 2 [Coniophora puteana RWD-64-598 SS2]
MALRPSSPASSLFSKKKQPLTTAASYLSAVHEADQHARARSIDRSSSPTPNSTPALSLSSSVTASSEDTVLHEDDESGLNYPWTPPTSEQVFSTVHTEFGHCANESYRCVSQHDYANPVKEKEIEEPPYYILITTYLSYLILICFGHVRDFFGKRFAKKYFTHVMSHKGYAALNSDFDSFYTRRLKARMDDCFSQPITGVAGRTVVTLDRYSTDNNWTQIYTGTKTRVLNISSYNYLGFAQARGGCADAVEESIKRFGISTCGSRLQGGTGELHGVAEALVAKFVGMEDALISSMGFATNSTFIPALVGKGCLVISDELNHASIRTGVRQSGAQVRMFKHNDMENLENLLRDVISQGQPRTHRPWRKILIIVEGLYSMEGTLVNLPRIIELKRKYKFYLFIDEAHSIGALGPHGRGVCDYFGINPRDVDVLMGTFTKSFGAAGGYIAGPKTLIDALRLRGQSGAYAESMPPPVLTQVMASMASIMGVAPPTSQSSKSGVMSTPSSTSTLRLGYIESEEHPCPAPASAIPSWLSLPPHLQDGSEGRTRLRRLAFNSRYLHAGLSKLGFITYGHPFSPIVPLLIFNPGKMSMFARMMRARSTPIVVVVVAYPATPLVTSRVRFCVSAAHTKEDIDVVLRACDEIGDVLDLKHSHGERWAVDEICKRSVELVEGVAAVQAA